MKNLAGIVKYCIVSIAKVVVTDGVDEVYGNVSGKLIVMGIMSCHPARYFSKKVTTPRLLKIQCKQVRCISKKFFKAIVVSPPAPGQRRFRPVTHQRPTDPCPGSPILSKVATGLQTVHATIHTATGTQGSFATFTLRVWVEDVYHLHPGVKGL